MFIIILGQHVSIVIESSSGSSKKIDPYLKCLKMRCWIPNVYILDKTLLSKDLYSLEGPEDDTVRIETCRPNTIINIIKFCCV